MFNLEGVAQNCQVADINFYSINYNCDLANCTPFPLGSNDVGTPLFLLSQPRGYAHVINILRIRYIERDVIALRTSRDLLMDRIRVSYDSCGPRGTDDDGSAFFGTTLMRIKV